MTAAIGVIQFPGSNTERETNLALKRSRMNPVEILWNETPEKVQSCDGYIITGGFSFEDRSRAGVIASLEPIMDILKVETK
jgi:phosphoribosylformylglycinamidine synthase